MSDSSPTPDSEETTSPTVVKLKGELPYLGSRTGANEVRQRLLEIVRGGDVATADIDGVAVLTPGYADECFGGLIDALGEEQFRKSIVIKNAAEPCALIIEAILDQHAPSNRSPDEVAAVPEEPEAEVEASAGDDDALAEPDGADEDDAGADSDDDDGEDTESDADDDRD